MVRVGVYACGYVCGRGVPSLGWWVERLVRVRFWAVEKE